jgi:hypothetical protein
VLLALTSHHAPQWHTLSWWVDWLGVIGFPLTLAGLFLTWRQAREASNAATAARDAVQRTQQQIRLQQLMALIPQLAWTASEIDSAIEDDAFPLVRRYLRNWRNQGSTVHGILLSADPADSEAATVLNKSIGMASVAEGMLIRKAKEATRTDCMKVRQAISIAVVQLTTWVGKNSTATFPDEGGEA